MITIEKLKEYEEFHGYYDGFYFQKVKNDENLTSEDEWFLIDELVQEFNLVKKGLASVNFRNKLKIRLEQSFDSQESLEYFQHIAINDW